MGCTESNTMANYKCGNEIIGSAYYGLIPSLQLQKKRRVVDAKY